MAEARLYRDADALRMEPIHRAGVDITTGHGCDSWFSDEHAVRDPWATECLVTLADVVINAADVVYPLPSETAKQHLERKVLPHVFVVGQDQGLLAPQLGRTAASVRLLREDLLAEWATFVETIRREGPDRVRQWGELHVTDPRITGARIHIQTRVVDDVWPELESEVRILAVQGLREEHLRYAFDVFVRTVQYADALGSDTAYFAHRIRARALRPFAQVERAQEMWSWGRYLAWAMESGRAPRDVHWYMDRVVEIRAKVRERSAGWYDHQSRPIAERVDLVTSIAAELDLPARLTRDAVSHLRNAYTALALGVPFVSTDPVVQWFVRCSLFAGVVVVDRAPRDVSGSRGQVGFLKGCMEWPELLGSRSSGVAAVQR